MVTVDDNLLLKIDHWFFANKWQAYRHIMEKAQACVTVEQTKRSYGFDDLPLDWSTVSADDHLHNLAKRFRIWNDACTRWCKTYFKLHRFKQSINGPMVIASRAEFIPLFNFRLTVRLYNDYVHAQHDWINRSQKEIEQRKHCRRNKQLNICQSDRFKRLEQKYLNACKKQERLDYCNQLLHLLHGVALVDYSVVQI